MALLKHDKRTRLGISKKHHKTGWHERYEYCIRKGCDRVG